MPIVLSGVEQTIAMLGRFQPYAARAVQEKVKQATKPLVSKARGFAPTQSPLSGWSKEVGAWSNRSYNGLDVKLGIGFADTPTKPNRKGFSYSAYIYNKSTAGQIYETAGRRHPNGRAWAPLVQHYADAGTPNARPDYMIRNSDKKYSKSGNPRAGKQFIDSMGPIYKPQRVKGQKGRSNKKQNGRLIFRAWGEDQGKVLAAVAAAYTEVINKFNGQGLK
jgi:hypothetical protein